MSPHKPTESSWRLFDITEYRLETSLTPAECAALESVHSRSGMLRMKPAPDLIRPLKDIAAASGCSKKIAGLVIAGLLREIHSSGMPCWRWTQERWRTLCREAREGRPLMAAFAWHLAGFHEPLSLPGIRKPVLYASAIFGQAIFHQELQRLTDTLTSLGYAPGSQKNYISGILATLMIMYRAPRLETFTPELLWQAQSVPLCRAGFARTRCAGYHQRPDEDAKLHEVVREAGGRHRSGLGALVPALAGNVGAQAAHP